MSAARLGIRWTIGDVSDAGFEALALSIRGAVRLFGADARYSVQVNTVGVERARARTGAVPPLVEWREASDALPGWLVPYIGEGYAEGVAWKLAPLRVFPERHELALDNDVILWKIPASLERWLDEETACLVAEDVRACFGRFSDLCGAGARNLGIRGLGPRFDFEGAVRGVLRQRPVRLESELDEQGLQLAALQLAPKLYAVRVAEVTICSPFPPHLPYLGECGAHFCGVNARRLGWERDGMPAEAHLQEHWRRWRGVVADRVGRVFHAPVVHSVPTRARRAAAG